MATQNLSNACLQRRLFVSLENSTRDRAELVNPYTNFTKQQLDMRRKAEILKYKKNANIITRTERFRILAHNIGRRNRACVNDPPRLTPSSSSNVPGPVILLNNATNAPLYNYTNQKQQTTLIPPPNLKAKIFDARPIERAGIRTIFTPIANLVILSPNFRNYNFTTCVPIFISSTGSKTRLNQNNGTNIQSITASLTNIQFQITYNNRRIATVPTNVNNLLGNMDLLLNIPGDIFSASRYLGLICFTNFRLQTCSEYVYSIQMSATVRYSAFNNQGNPIPQFVSTGMSSTVLCNLTQRDANYFSVSNCTMVNPPTLPISPFSTTAVPFGAASLS